MRSSTGLLEAVSVGTRDEHWQSQWHTPVVNEVLCKLLCHNLSCLIQEQEELGIVPMFWKDDVDGRADVLPMAKPG